MLSKGLSISTARPSLSAAGRRGRTGEEPVASTTRSPRSTRSRAPEQVRRVPGVDREDVVLENLGRREARRGGRRDGFPRPRDQVVAEDVPGQEQLVERVRLDSGPVPYPPARRDRPF